ncbi:hypothetical protein SEVIR_7G317600v4 [Setaria viridis]|nr:disease resistance protein RGA2-like [Setaria viridis]TKW07597.1 hypothetical protein SEVIR_7G317600v2 [Setaria viridis]
MTGVEAAAISAVVSGILKIVGNKLAPPVIKKYSSIVGVEKDLQELQDRVVEINSWLERAECQAMETDASFNWLKQLKDFAYAVDDVVDEFQMRAEKHDASAAGGIVSNYMCLQPKSFIFHCKAAKKIKAINRRFAAIVKQRTDSSVIANSLPPIGHPAYMNEIPANSPSLPVVDVASVLGRDQEKNQIISKLIKTNDRQRIRIFSIIGLGGSGKTTLAKLVFNDGNIIEKHYEVRLWVHVSQEFDVNNLIKKLFEAIANRDPGQHALPYMSNKILDKLTGKRFLVVLDDVWTESRIKWKELMVYLNNGASGSGILLTTRSRQVAVTVESTYQFDLPLLSPGDSWQLFQQCLVIPRKGWDFEFEQIGKEIVKKCAGVPLAIKVLAGALRGRERIEEWQAMRDNNLLDVKGEDHSVSVFACLRLSYFHLPSHLKQCFTICSMFPKGHKIDKEQLIDIWIAHDMIIPMDGVHCLEYIGHRYFGSLLQVFFLQDVNEYNGRVTCRMHDLVHDLAQSVTDIFVPKEETSSTKSYRYFSLTGHEIKFPSKNRFEKARAIYVDNGDDTTFGNTLKNARHLRSITMERLYAAILPTVIFQVKNLKYLGISRLRCEVLPDAISNIWSLQALHVTFSDLLKLPKSIGKLQKLRTLNLSQCVKLMCLPDSIGDCQMISVINLCNCKEITVLPNSIIRNTNLRVLRLGYTKIERLPSSITTLRNLECLDLHECHGLVELPEGIGNLHKLQILDLDGCNGLGSMPVGIGKLRRLQKLGLFAVGDGETSAKISEIGNIIRISGKLSIRGVAHVMSPADAHSAWLKQKMNLQMLTLNWRCNDFHSKCGRCHDDSMNTDNELAILDGLEPPSGIRVLRIIGYAGCQYMRWMQKQVGIRSVQALSHFPRLTEVTLSDLPKLKQLEGLVELPCLEELELRRMPALESISGGPFPSLMELKMNDLPSLGEFWMFVSGGEETECGSNYSCHHVGQVAIGNRLSYICIEKCPKLMVKPHFPSSLDYLELDWSNGQLLQLVGQDHGSIPPSFSLRTFTAPHTTRKRILVCIRTTR